MTVSFVFAAFQALAALPGLLKILQDIAAGAVLFYVQHQTTANLQAIADATALAARAVSDDERYQAAATLRDVLSRPRIST